jgi:hypothetical protein
LDGPERLGVSGIGGTGMLGVVELRAHVT